MRILYLKPQIKGNELIFVEEKESEEKLFSEIENIDEKLLEFNLKKFINRQSMKLTGLIYKLRFS